MRNHVNPQAHLFRYLSLDERVPAKYPLSSIRSCTDAALKQIRPSLDEIYRAIGRRSIPPEHLLKVPLLIALYSVRSDELFCQTLDYDILFRWIWDMGLEEFLFDASTFSKNRERLAKEELTLKIFDAVARGARALQLLSDERFSVDGTLIEAWASMRSFCRKNGGGEGSDAGGNRDFYVDVLFTRQIAPRFAINATHYTICLRSQILGIFQQPARRQWGGHATNSI